MHDSFSGNIQYYWGNSGGSAVRTNKVAYKLTGVIMAIAGAVIVIHTVPVSIWWIVLVALVLVFGFVMLNDSGRRK